eukprot:4125905-Karenia_brevis.AAC.1
MVIMCAIKLLVRMVQAMAMRVQNIFLTCMGSPNFEIPYLAVTQEMHDFCASLKIRKDNSKMAALRPSGP